MADFEDTSRHVRLERVNKWPNSMIYEDDDDDDDDDAVEQLETMHHSN
jgi:hypothetical protein